MRKIGTLVALLLVAPAISFANTLDDLLVQQGVVTKSSDAAAMGSMGSSKVYYNGGTRFEFPDSGLTAKWNTQLQTRYEFTDNDDGVENTSSFSVRRARLQVSGNALNNEFAYKVQVDFVGSSDDDGASTPDLRDAYLEWHACDWMWVRSGQFKTALSRQFNGSSAKLQFADRSLASEYYSQDRANGLAIGGNWDSISWMAQMTNGNSPGEGRNRPGVDTNHAAYAQVRYTDGEIDIDEEGDVNGTEDMAWALGFTYGYSQDDLGGLDDQDTSTYNADFSWKYQGWSLAAEYFHRTVDDNNAVDLEDDGFYAQVGYFLTPHEWEIAARYSGVYYDNEAELDQTEEVSATVNYYWWKHQLKANIGYVYTTDEPDEGDSTDTSRWVVQLSSWL